VKEKRRGEKNVAHRPLAMPSTRLRSSASAPRRPKKEGRKRKFSEGEKRRKKKRGCHVSISFHSQTDDGEPWPADYRLFARRGEKGERGGREERKSLPLFSPPEKGKKKGRGKGKRGNQTSLPQINSSTLFDLLLPVFSGGGEKKKRKGKKSARARSSAP